MASPNRNEKTDDTSTTAPGGLVTHWIDKVDDATWFCEHILEEAPKNRWLCGASTPATGRQDVMRIAVTPETKVVAVDLEGINLSRTGEITIVSVATEKGVYLFDIVSLGARGVEVLRTHLLQNPTVLKVLFDCRQDCDSLYHQYSCQVHPICDLQVSCVVHLFPPDRRNYLVGMAKCFKDNLKLFSAEELAVKQAVGLKTFDNKGGDPQLWKRRPIDPDLIVYSAIDVKHMFSAMEILSKSSMAEPGATIALGITVGCGRRDRAVFSQQPVPHSAECDFTNLLQVAESRARSHGPAVGTGTQEGGEEGYSYSKQGALIWPRSRQEQWEQQHRETSRYQQRFGGGGQSFHGRGGFSVPGSFSNAQTAYYPQQLPQCLYCQEVGHTMMHCPHQPAGAGMAGPLPSMAGHLPHHQQHNTGQPPFLNPQHLQQHRGRNAHGYNQETYHQGLGRDSQQQQYDQQAEAYQQYGNQQYGVPQQQIPPQQFNNPMTMQQQQQQPQPQVEEFDQQQLVAGGPPGAHQGSGSGSSAGGSGLMHHHSPSYSSSMGSGSFTGAGTPNHHQQQQQQQPGATSSPGGSSSPQQLSCYTCGGVGHINRNCPSRVHLRK